MATEEGAGSTSMSGVIEGRDKQLLFPCMNIQCDWNEATAKYVCIYIYIYIHVCMH